VYLNRSIVVMELEGPDSALKCLETIVNNQSLKDYYLFHALMGEIYIRLKNRELARKHLERAQNLTLSIQEKRFLSDKLEIL